MIASVLFGLAAATAWGTSDFVTSLLGRRASPFLILAAAHLAAVVVMTLALPALDVTTPTGGQLAGAIGLGGLSVVVYLCLFGSLARGPLTIVSPIAASWAVVTVLLAVLALGEPLGVTAAAACVVIAAGVALGAWRTSPGAAAAARLGTRSGVPLALGAMASMGVYNLLLGRLAQDMGWFLPLYVSRCSSAAILLAIAAGRRQLPWRRLDRRTLLVAIAMPGTVATLGGLAFNAGAAQGHISITAAASSVYPLIPAVAGIVLLGERVARHQAVGLAGILVGLVVLGLSS